MFGRRRHAAIELAAPVPVPQLSEAQILELIHNKVAEVIGENGTWIVSRRTESDTDAIFHAMLAKSVAVEITAALVDAKRQLAGSEELSDLTIDVIEAEPRAAEADEFVAAETDKHVAAPAAETDTVVGTVAEGIQEEPAAFSWEPAPITVWTDLRKPVTGEIPAITQHAA